MAKRTFQLLLLIILAFASASYVVFSTILADIEQNDRAKKSGRGSVVVERDKPCEKSRIHAAQRQQSEPAVSG